MSSDPSSIPIENRLGFHYYPDTTHYTQSDLRTWLPELKALGAAWLTLIAPNDRAIPESFLSGLMHAGIEPILHFHLPLKQHAQLDSLHLLFNTYARWGVRYSALFDRPNLRSAWSTSDWAQSDLVERFLDCFIPIAEYTLEAGLIPVFPPLQPGGDYWDTSFLKAALMGIQRRGCSHLLKSLAIGAYAWADEHPLSWGAGGPERWPGSRPYDTPENQEDQKGFYIFDWYQAIYRTVRPESARIILLGAGYRLKPGMKEFVPAAEITAHAQSNLALASLAHDSQSLDFDSEVLETLPAEVIACNFWLLSASPESPYASQAWYQPDGSVLPIVDALRQWLAGTPPVEEPIEEPIFPNDILQPEPSHRIEHYLLLPLYEWGVVEWHLDVIRPYILRHHPTIGFSLAEAALAKHVTVLGGDHTFSEEDLENLRQSGCAVERISGDGTSIATQMEVL